MTRSLQSPSELVKPHATSPLLPATSEGTPGSVTPVRRRDGEFVHTIDARYQMFGTESPRCMSLATIAPPSAVSRPATAQLLLPRQWSSMGAESQASIASVSSASCRDDGACATRGELCTSNTLASGIGGTPITLPASGVSQSLAVLVK